MPYTLNSNVIKLFTELRNSSDELIQHQALDQLYALFDGLIHIFNDIETNSDLLTSSAISLMKEKDSLADHRLLFSDCYDAYRGHPKELINCDLLAELRLEYDLLIHQYDVILDDLSPSKELSLKELVVLMHDVYLHFKTSQHKNFLDHLVLTIEYIKKLDETSVDFNSFNGVDLRANLNTLLELAPSEIKAEIEKINAQLILHYEIQNLKFENASAQLPTETLPVVVSHNVSSKILPSLVLGLMSLGLLAGLVFLIESRREDNSHEVAEGYCSSSYHM